MRAGAWSLLGGFTISNPPIGATPGPGTTRCGGETSCLAISDDNGGLPTLVLDGGTGVRRLTRMLDGTPFRGMLVLSHLQCEITKSL